MNIYYYKPLVISKYPQKLWYEGNINHMFLEDIDVDSIYQNFEDKVLNSISNKYLPIYRMADGEYIFLLSNIFRYNGISFRVLKYKIKTVIKGFGTCWKEHYSFSEVIKNYNKYINDLRTISNQGILAMYMMYRHDTWDTEIYDYIIKIFKKENIYIKPNNYVPFYFVYALLNCIDKRKIYKDRRLLIATSMDVHKRKELSEYFYSIGVSNIKFIEISANKAMLDKLDTKSICKDDIYDVALVAGGVGAANIINQLSFVRGPVIDCGITLECYINKELRTTRPFLQLW